MGFYLKTVLDKQLPSKKASRVLDLSILNMVSVWIYFHVLLKMFALKMHCAPYFFISHPSGLLFVLIFFGKWAKDEVKGILKKIDGLLLPNNRIQICSRTKLSRLVDVAFYQYMCFLNLSCLLLMRKKWVVCFTPCINWIIVNLIKRKQSNLHYTGKQIWEIFILLQEILNSKLKLHGYMCTYTFICMHIVVPC